MYACHPSSTRLAASSQVDDPTGELRAAGTTAALQQAGLGPAALYDAASFTAPVHAGVGGDEHASTSAVPRPGPAVAGPVVAGRVPHIVVAMKAASGADSTFALVPSGAATLHPNAPESAVPALQVLPVGPPRHHAQGAADGHDDDQGLGDVASPLGGTDSRLMSTRTLADAPMLPQQQRLPADALSGSADKEMG
jgi:hypothetical protein